MKYLNSYHSSVSQHYQMGIHWWSPNNTERLVNLSILLDGLALHDQLYVLKAELPPDTEVLNLRKLLLNKGILQELDTTPYLPKIKNEFDTFHSSLVSSNQKGLHRYRKNEGVDIAKIVAAFLGGNTLESKSSNKPHFGLYRESPEVILEGLKQEYEGTLSHWWLDKYTEELASKPFLALGKHILENVNYFSSGAVISGISHLRIFVYWRVSEHARIPLYPSSQRIPQIDVFSDHIRSSVSEKVYQVVAAAYKSNVETVYEDETQIPLFLPPTLAVFFEIHRSTHDLEKTIDIFRKEFAGIRRDFRLLEERLVASSTLQERIEIKRQLEEVVRSVKKYHEMNDDSFIEAILGFAPEVLNPLSNPTDPSKYSKELLTKPLTWIKDWWKSRPLRHVFRLRKRLYAVSNYERLVSDAIGIEFNQEEKKHYLERYSELIINRRRAHFRKRRQ
ncbi:hypothetical protein L0244_21940 [bacterium]|nr:hypothetical protein [bacterium]